MSDGRIIIDTQIDSGGAEKGIKSLNGMVSSGLGSITKATAAMATVATVAVGGIVKASIEQFAQYEQLVGGVETLFKDSRNVVIGYAEDAYKTAGMSANEYMRTITGFSASLLQGLGGDTKKAAEIGNLAVTDMADNANKMGTGIENIQNAYQGFAKQNYMMLDNLKLGYGGTKTEMERLLVDAEKLTGIKYNISNFSDVIAAIHAIQTQMGITGTTAKEASSTIEGSLNMTKAAWSNLLTNMAFEDADFDTLVNNLVDSAGALGENLLPRVEIALNGVGELIKRLLPPIAEKMPEIIMSLLPKMVEAGTNVITALITGIQANLPIIVTGAIEIANSLINALITILPQLLDMGMKIIIELANGIAKELPILIPLVIQVIMKLITTLLDNAPLIVETGWSLLLSLVEGIVNAIPILIAMLPAVIQSFLNYFTTSLPIILYKGQEILVSLLNGILGALPQLIAALPQLIVGIVNFIGANLPLVLETGITLLKAIIQGLIDTLPVLIAMLPQIITSIITVLTENLPLIIEAGITILVALIKGLINALPQLIAMLPQIVNTIIYTLIDNLPLIINAGVQILIAIIGGLIQAIPRLIGAIPQIIGAITKAFGDVDWLDIGINILEGIGKGLIKGIGSIISSAKKACSSIKNSITGFFDIHSPSRLMRDLVGVNIMRGIGVGVELETPNLNKDINSSMAEIAAKMKGAVDFKTSKTTEAVVAQNNFSISKDNPTIDATGNGGIPEGSTFIVKNEMDSEVIGESCYKVVNGKLALVRRGAR